MRVEQLKGIRLSSTSGIDELHIARINLLRAIVQQAWDDANKPFDGATKKRKVCVLEKEDGTEETHDASMCAKTFLGVLQVNAGNYGVDGLEAAFYVMREVYGT